ncbi:MAG: hisD [Myxococcaceae bacterium]|nr:hisD [Myxococcaceae bacterium]
MTSSLPLFDLATEQGRNALTASIERLRPPVGHGSEASRTVAAIVADVRQEGDEAVVRYMRKWTDPAFSRERMRVSEAELDAAERALSPELRAALIASIENVRAYQTHLMPKSPEPITHGGAEMGLRFTPVDSVGLAVPGGKAAYPSSVIMLAIPAQVAGVAPDRICVVTPPPTHTGEGAAADVHPLVLAACKLVGVKNVFRIGGAQAMAALAFGTDSVPAVDMIVGPGNNFVQVAKAQLAGVIGTDGFYGPSEILTIADESADPRKVAADLLAQAEHDPGKCFLVSWQPETLARISTEIDRQLKLRKRGAALEVALREDSCAVLVRDVEEAAAVANRIACEHVSLAVADPDALLPSIRHAGEILLGDSTPMAAGDYWAGPSHCLPTGTTGRFSSGLSPYTFLKRVGTIRYRNGIPAAARDAIVLLAEAEGLDGHAESARVRG